jgi:hypothetical protein
MSGGPPIRPFCKLRDVRPKNASIVSGGDNLKSDERQLLDRITQFILTLVDAHGH